MTSSRRILASQANGSLSRGPITAAGKASSSRNSVRHGLLARCLVLEDESSDAFQSLLVQHIERLQPADELELGMVEEMVAAWWRMRRVWAIETRLLDAAASSAEAPGAPDNALDRIAAAFAGLAASPALPLLHRYETRLHLVHRRALHNLLMLRAAMPNEPNPISEHSVVDVQPGIQADSGQDSP